VFEDRFDTGHLMVDSGRHEFAARESQSYGKRRQAFGEPRYEGLYVLLIEECAAFMAFD
jgi:hypothetical protein